MKLHNNDATVLQKYVMRKISPRFNKAVNFPHDTTLLVNKVLPLIAIGKILTIHLFSVLFSSWNYHYYNRVTRKGEAPITGDWIDVAFKMSRRRYRKISKVERKVLFSLGSKWTKYARPMRCEFMWMSLCYINMSSYLMWYLDVLKLWAPHLCSVSLLISTKTSGKN